MNTEDVISDFTTKSYSFLKPTDAKVVLLVLAHSKYL